MSRVVRPPRGPLCRIGLALCLAVLVILSGCTKSADATKSARKKAPASPPPAQLTLLPGDPLLVMHVNDPAKLGGKWVAHMRQELGASPVSDWLEETFSSIGKDLLGALPGGLAIGVYGDPQRDPEPDVMILVAGGKAEQLDPCLPLLLGPDPRGGEFVDELGVTKSQFESGTKTWFHGEIAGFWAATTKQEFIKQTQARALNHKPGPFTNAVFQSCWKACGGMQPEFFLAASLPNLENSAQMRRVMKGLGVDKVQGLGYAFSMQDKQCSDVLYVVSPRPHMGAMRLFGGEAISPKELLGVSESDLGFGFMSVDIEGLWGDVRQSLPPMVTGQISSMEKNFGFSFEGDLLGSLGKTWSNHTFQDASSDGLSSVVRFPMEDGKKFDSCVKKLMAAAPGLKWRPGPPGFRVLQVPMQIPGRQDMPVLAAGPDDWYFASSAAAFENFLVRAEKASTHPQVAKVSQRFPGATMLMFSDARCFQLPPEQMQQMRALPSMLGSMDGPAKNLPDLIAQLPWDDLEGHMQSVLGDVVAAIVPSSEGIEFVLESRCGVFPVVGMAALVSISELQKGRMTKDLIAIEEVIGSAQLEYRNRHGRYAVSLWELRNDSLIDRAISSGISGDFLYRIQSDGRNWQVQFKKGNSAFTLGDDGSTIPLGTRTGE